MIEYRCWLKIVFIFFVHLVLQVTQKNLVYTTWKYSIKTSMDLILEYVWNIIEQHNSGFEQAFISLAVTQFW